MMIIAALKKRDILIFTSFCIILTLFFSTRIRAEELIDGVVAVVFEDSLTNNNKAIENSVILHSEVKERAREASRIWPLLYYPANKSSSSYDKSLNELINMRLILNAVEKMGIKVSDEMVDNHVKLVIKRQPDWGGNILEFEKLLLREGQTLASYRQNVKQQIIFQHFKNTTIRPKINITDSDIRSYYLAKNRGESALSDSDIELVTRQIVLSSQGDEVLDKEKESQANKIYTLLKSGASFKELEALNSDSKFSNDKNILEKHVLSELNPQVKKELKDLKEGDFSRPIKISKLGWYLFYIEKLSVRDSQDFLNHKKELIKELEEREMNKKITQWLMLQINLSKVKRL